VSQQAVYAREVENIRWIILGRGVEALSVPHLTRKCYETRKAVDRGKRLVDYAIGTSGKHLNNVCFHLIITHFCFICPQCYVGLLRSLQVDVTAAWLLTPPHFFTGAQGGVLSQTSNPAEAILYIVFQWALPLLCRGFSQSPDHIVTTSSPDI
jgi:hypothetical protein